MTFEIFDNFWVKFSTIFVFNYCSRVSDCRIRHGKVHPYGLIVQFVGKGLRTLRHLLR